MKRQGGSIAEICYLAGLCALFAVGCAPRGLELNDATDGATSVRVDAPSVQVQPVHRSAPSLGAAALALVVILPIRATKANLDERDVLSQLPAVNFQRESERALRVVLAANYSIAGGHSESADARLELSSKYFLSPRCRTLVIETTLRFYVPNKRRPILSSSLVYQSKEFFASTCQEWSNEDSKRYDAFVDEGTAEIAKMVVLVMSGATLDSSKGRAQLSFVSFIGSKGPRQVTITGELIEQDDSRTLFQSRAGAFYSLANTDIFPK